MRAALFARAAACLLAAAMMTQTGSDIYAQRYSAKYHYDVRRDMSVYFKNSDEVIEKLRTRLKEKYRYVTIEYVSQSDNMQDIEELVRELMGYALAETDSPDEGDYLACNMGGYTLEYSVEQQESDFVYSIKINPLCYTTPEQEQMVSDRVSEILANLGIDDTLSDYEKVRRIYDHIYENVSFDIIHIKNDNYHLKSTAYAALINHTAACQGYAAAVYRLMRSAGIGCRVLTGMATSPKTGESEYHAWKIVCIDGVYYNLDATWDCVNKDHECFLKGSEDFPGHKEDEKFTGDFKKQYNISKTSYGKDN